ncbi:MAG: DUF1294 domain-containing protein [Lachnospiraceae bacterium]|nr:DUF1294 domain-containing protein [Lachnospiraceae bacterium]
METWLIIVIIYLVIVNLVALGMFAADKNKAQKNKWRIPEKALFLIAIIGGSIGAIGGMYIFRHKTKHWYFVVGMPLILILQIVGGVLVYKWIA